MQLSLKLIVTVPLHWQKEVKDMYGKDLAMGVLERWPPDEDNDWCAREVYSAKANGKLRRTVDYRNLNRWIKRDAFAT